jgi:hypothetical protein
MNDNVLLFLHRSGLRFDFDHGGIARV